ACLAIHPPAHLDVLFSLKVVTRMHQRGMTSCRRPCHEPRLNVQSRLGASDVPTDTKLTDTKLKEIIAEQEEIFVRRQPTSQRLAEQAKQHLAGGVTSSWQITAPQPVWLSHGRGSKVTDVDGNEYVDLHGGYGAALAGHAHPA